MQVAKVYNMQKIATSAFGNLKNGSYVHVSGANSSNITGIIALRQQLFSAFSGMTSASFVSTSAVSTPAGGHLHTCRLT